jgi:uncharacterized protein YjcR
MATLKTKSKDNNRDYAFVLYMQGKKQKEIAERCSVVEKTISDWKNKYGWEAKRAAKTISMDELIVKALRKINTMLDDDNFNADSFAKAVAQLKNLKTKNTVDDEIMCFMDFQNYLMERRQIDLIDETFIKQLVKYQDAYIQKRMGNE